MKGAADKNGVVEVESWGRLNRVVTDVSVRIFVWVVPLVERK